VVIVVASLASGCFQRQLRIVVKDPERVEVAVRGGGEGSLERIRAAAEQPAQEGYVFADEGAKIEGGSYVYLRRGTNDDWIALEPFSEPEWRTSGPNLHIFTRVHAARTSAAVTLRIPRDNLCTLERRTQAYDPGVTGVVIGGGWVVGMTLFYLATGAQHTRDWLLYSSGGVLVLGAGIAALALPTKPELVLQGACRR
jgi:hypothetical protein